jgi:CheY-like chemotaxis protein
LSLTGNLNFSLKVLVVEDNEVNQLVASKYLQKWGIYPDLADNGRIAVEKAKQNSYDLILMDLQMPEMDGYEATKSIRLLNPHYAEIPIIALTAASFGEIKEKVANAGLNEFITKPFSPTELFDIISKYSEAKPEEIKVLPKDVIDLPEGKIKGKIKHLTQGDSFFMNELTKLYISSLHELRTLYNQYLREHNLTRLREIRHKHKANIDMLDLPELASRLENGKQLLEGPTFDEDKITQLADYVEQYCILLIEQLEELQNNQ